MRVRTLLCVLILLIDYYMCPHTTVYVSSYYCIGVLILYVSSCLYMRALILLYMCPHTTVCVSSFYYICVLMLLHACPLPQEWKSFNKSKRFGGPVLNSSGSPPQMGPIEMN
jgi:hypothetical protein